MARIEIDPNYSAPTYSRATAPTDLFKATDVQALAAAVSTHTHGAGLGLPIAAGAIPAGTITGAMIADGTISTADLADGAVTSAKIADGSITATDIAAGAIGSAQIADGSITTADLGDGQVTSAKLAANVAISGTLSVAGVTTLSGVTNATGPLNIATNNPINLGPAPAQQVGALNVSNSYALAWRNAANTADLAITVNNQNDLVLQGFRGDGGPATLTGTAPLTMRVIFNGTLYRIPLMT